MKKIALVVAVSLAIAACHDGNSDVARVVPAAQAVPAPTAAPGQATAPQTVIVQQPAQQSSSTGDLLTGAALGAMATHLFSSSRAAPTPASAPTQIIERRTIIKQVERPAPKPAAPVAASKAPGYGASFSKPRAPSYGSSFSKSSSFSSRPSSFGRR